MCGITGVISFSYEETDSLELIHPLTEAIRHRGPDDEGYFFGSHVALGHRRLSIIDLEGGKQPLTTADGRYTIVYNGEIFNYRKLRSELVSRGLSFRTNSDTEVLLEGFAMDGVSFLDRLDGMFAFLIFDSQVGQLYAGRDPFGIKPLYGYSEGRNLFIASEIKAIHSVVDDRFRVNPNSLGSYLMCGYVPGSATMVRNLFRFKPGVVTTIGRSGGRKELPFSKQIDPEQVGSIEKCSDLRSVLVSAVERSLVSDVPVGLYLSGGIDSSLIAAIVSRDLGQKLQSFSVGFPEDPSHDEERFAAQVAKELGLSHETISAQPEDFLNLESLARTLEEPMVDPSALFLGQLSHRVAAQVKVVLSGEGGDELFGGYHRYYWDQMVERYLRFPAWLRGSARDLAALCPSEGMKRRVRKLRETEEFSRPSRYTRWFSPFRKDELANLQVVPGELNADRSFDEAFAAAAKFSGSAQLQWVDLITFLRDDLLPKADKMSMANSLEVRVPFLQADVLRAAFSLEESQRVSGKTKPALRSLLGNYLPASIVNRKKRGFEVPLGKWFRGSLKPLLDQYASEAVVRDRGFLEWETVSAIRSEHGRGTSDRGPALYSICFLEAWCREYLES